MKIQIAKISKKIRNLREQKRITQEQLAKELGVSRQSIIAIERGRCLPSLPVALSLAEVFDMALESIFRKEVNQMTDDLTPYSPMRQLSNLHETIDHLFEESWPTGAKTRLAVPTVNVYEKAKIVVVEAEVPGVKEEDLSIEVGDDQLIIKGEKKSESEVKEKDYYRRETSYGSFSRTVALPAEVDKNKTTAELKDGVLTVTLPKTAKTMPKVTKVKVTKK